MARKAGKSSAGARARRARAAGQRAGAATGGEGAARGGAGNHGAWLGARSEEERMLVVLRDALYAGRWEPMLRDLRKRLEGLPYIFKLVHRIRQDIQRIEELQAYEQRYGINLGEFLPRG